MKPTIQILFFALQIRCIASLVLFLLIQTTLADILTVKQDSTGDYTVIQDAINGSSDGDTVLVWPGIYYENVDFTGKNITLSSRMMTTNNPAFKFNTIIDGNHSGTCVLINSDETNAVLFGFTIQNGSGYDEFQDGETSGGGIFVTRADCEIFNCIIKNNFANYGGGGGIYIGFYCEVYLSGNSIFNNHCYNTGGGMFFGFSTAVFDSVNRNSIYSNYASKGCELAKNTEDTLRLFLDTCTVSEPDNYFLYSVGPDGFHKKDIEPIITNSLLIPVDSNLYVNPEIGSNDNIGLSWEEPLKTIAYAYSKIAIDSLEKNTIYLADGIYSDTMNGEKFPLNVRPYIKVEGSSRDSTILDGEYKSRLLKGNNEVSEYGFSKMTLRRGTNVIYNNHFINYSGLVFSYINNNISFDSIHFSQGHSYGAYAGVSIIGCNNTVFNNCEISGHLGGAAMIVGLWGDYETCFINNCKFISNKPDTLDPELIKPGRGLVITGSLGIGVVTNSLFVDNDWQAFLSSSAAFNYLVNCTFVDNSYWKKENVLGISESSCSLYNCIVFDNAANNNFTLYSNGYNTTLSIYNSLIEGGEGSIEFHSSCDDDCFYYYDETNIDTDPDFLGKWGHPYQIADGSPCIDAGTLSNLPDFIELPETDLAGNPRVVGDSIDMGAYEWNATVGIDKYQYQPIKNDKPKLLHAAPNPFSSGTTISSKWDFTGHVQIEVYNNAGLRVKVLKSGASGPGSIQAQWKGTDANGNTLPTGVYHVLMFWDGKEVDGVKVIKQ